MNLEALKSVIFTDNFKITLHALNEMMEDSVSLYELKKSIQGGDIIEDYPSSKPLPACLILSFNSQNKPIHSVWAYDDTSSRAILVTVYRPNPEKWVKYKKRKN